MMEEKIKCLGACVQLMAALMLVLFFFSPMDMLCPPTCRLCTFIVNRSILVDN